MLQHGPASSHSRRNCRIGFLALLLWLALLSPDPILAQDPDLRVWDLLICGFDLPEPVGPLPQEFEAAIAFPRPRSQDFDGTTPVQGGTQGSWTVPGVPWVHLFTPEPEQRTGQVGASFQAVIDGDPGQPDGATIAAFDVDITIGDWHISEFFFEYFAANGDLINSPDQSGLDTDAITASQCSLSWLNNVTQTVESATGLVKTPFERSKTEVFRDVMHGDAARFAQLMEEAQNQPEDTRTVIRFTGPVVPTDLSVLIDPQKDGFQSLFDVPRSVRIEGSPTFIGGGADNPAKFARIFPGGSLSLINTSRTPAVFDNWATSGSGAVLSTFLGGDVEVVGYHFIGSTADSHGGAVGLDSGSRGYFRNCRFIDNFADDGGGAASVTGADSTSFVGCVFEGNSTGAPNGACDVEYWDNNAPGTISSSALASDCDNPPLRATGSRVRLEGTDLRINLSDPIDLAALSIVYASGNILRTAGEGQQQAVSRPEGQDQVKRGNNRTEAACSVDESSDLISLGFNIATDDSCALDGPGDLPATDPLLSAPDEKGVSTPLPGSPAIDLGPAGLVEFDGQPELPCGWRDITGLGRPQDGDGDGGFECDAGPVEVQGTGAIQAGHSGAFFNSLRNGEGEYVEVLEDGRTVIYTFTYNPEGDGAAWFIGVGNVAGNSLVTEDMLRPEGTAWGDDFDTDAIDFADWGGMSMVFPGCAMGEPPGNVAFSGNETFEPLLTAAERLTDVFGCGAGVPPHANAGLSGSFYDPARNGEGLVIQYLPDGRVLAIMFTYDPDGRQIWMFGQAMASDKTVTMEVFYPTVFTAWGAGFDENDWTLDSWGEWTLTWTDCDTLVFEYDATVQGYGSGSREYTRLTNLLGGQCPGF